MPKMIKCRWHNDDTPSMAIYETHGHCFGCQKRVPLSELGEEGHFEERDRYVEPIQETVAYIQGLPTKSIRGLSLPYDDVGYYILWPGGKYYIRRNWSDSKARYHSPAGHSKPLFVAKHLPAPASLIVVEGQLNAISIAESGVKACVVSPGATGDFTKINNYPFYCVYSDVMLLLDNDGPGSIAGIELKAALLPMIKNVSIKLMPSNEDANEILQKYGKEILRQRVESFLLEARMPSGLYP
jgi:5S rRNA maturation endonuclease (ribonuclease M5)